MGTRSLTVLKDEENKEIAVLYRQYDGYPTGHGKELAEFCANREITNGICSGRTANGMGCLAAQIIAIFKTEVGGFYLYSARTRNCSEEYIYYVTKKADNEEPNITLKIPRYTKDFSKRLGEKLVFSAPASAFLAWCVAKETK
jgi:hypothetical protein